MNSPLISLNSSNLQNDIKKEYCLKNNIKLLEIPFWDYKNIKNILDNLMKLKKEVV